MKQITLILAWGLCFNLNAQPLSHPHEIIKSYWSESHKIYDSSLMLLPEQSQSIYAKHKIKLKEVLYKQYRVEDKSGSLLGFGLLISDRVRTKSMTLLLLIDTERKLKAVEVVAFAEPKEYKPASGWLKKHFSERKLDTFINNSQTPNISGATLSAHSVAKSAKTIAAIWKELHN